jgi:hypothetical protein
MIVGPRMLALVKADASLVLGNGREACEVAVQADAGRESSETTCRCAKCALWESVSRGNRLMSHGEERRHVVLKAVSTAPLEWLKAFALGTLKANIGVIFYLFALSMPVTILHSAFAPKHGDGDSLKIETFGKQNASENDPESGPMPHPEAVATKEQIYSPTAKDQNKDESSEHVAITEEQVLQAIAKSAVSVGPVISDIRHDSIDVDPLVDGLQLYAGTLDRYSASASDPGGNPMTWQWSYSIDRGSEKILTSGRGQVRPISYSYSAADAGEVFYWHLRVSNGTADGESELAVGVEAPPRPAEMLSFQAKDAVTFPPFILTNDYITQRIDTDATNGGRAMFYFTITNDGNYVIQANINAPNAGDSFWVVINSNTPPKSTQLPEGTDAIWDIIPGTTSFQQAIVSLRGSGTATNDQFTPAIFHLTPGTTNQLLIVGRSKNVGLQSITLLELPSVPQNLRISPTAVGKAPSFSAGP